MASGERDGATATCADTAGDAPRATGVFDDPRYARLALANAERYRTAQPFPHAVIDDLLPPDLAHAIARAFPRPEDPIDWIVRDNANNRKCFQHDETKLPLPLRDMLRELNSRQFVLFLETLTGVGNLITDPYYIGGGAHLSRPGDFLKVHVDFNWHHKLQAHRRLNAIYYANPGWDESWGGGLELWNATMSERVVTIAPAFNRLLVFSTSEVSFHGHPHPLACPASEHRRTLNLYFYTSKTDEERAAPHFTIYRTEANPFMMELGEKYRGSAGG